MKRIFLIAVTWLIVQLSFSQTPGMIRNFSDNHLRNTYIFKILQSSNRNIILQTYNGLVKFDSYQWQVKNFKRKVYDIVPFRDNLIIISDNAIIIYDELKDSLLKTYPLPEQSFYYNTVNFDTDKYAFVFDSLIVLFDSKNFSQKKPGFSYKGAIPYKSELYLYLPGYGFCDTTGNLVIPFDKDINLIFDLQYADKTFLGFDNNRIYYIDNYSVKPLKTDAQPYLDKNLLLSAAKLNDSTLAIATQTGGVILFSPEKQKTQFLLNNLTGLPDNEISSISADDNGNLWIAHGFGLSFVDFRLKVKNYAIYPGLQGRISYFWKNDTTLFVGTSSGLFYLTKPSNKELKQLITISRQTIDTVSNIQNKVKPKTNIITKIGRFFFTRNKKKQDTVAAQQSTVQTVRRKSVVKHKTVISDSALFYQNNHSLIFRQYKNIRSKVKKLCKINGQVYAVTYNAIYKLKGGKAEKIFSAPYIVDVAHDQFFAILTNNSIFLLVPGRKEPMEIKLDNENYNSIALQGYTIWAGNYGYSLRIVLNNRYKPVSRKTYKFPNAEIDPVKAVSIDNRVYLITPEAIYTTLKDSIFVSQYLNSSFSYSNTPGAVWIQSNDKPIVLSKQPVSDDVLKLLNIAGNISDIFTFDKNTFILTNREIIRLPNDYKLPDLQFKAYIEKLLPKDTNAITYNDINNFAILVKAPFYYGQKCQYRLGYIHKKDTVWQNWKNYYELTPTLQSGKNKLVILARNPFNGTSAPINLQINVKPPFTQTVWFYLLVYFILAALIALAFALRQKQLKKRNQLLEKMVKERTAEIEAQKEEIEAQRDKIQEQYEKISELHNELTSSIRYAQRIQAAMLPSQNILDEYFSDNFLIYLPRDVVSGDFYWWKKFHTQIVVAVADCTGHGVPGAFLTMLGNAFLNEITSKIITLDPGVILTKLREMVLATLHKYENKEISDGMDMSLIVFDKADLSLKFAGAYNPVYIIREQELIELKAQRMPIGRHPVITDAPDFKTTVMQMQENDHIYMFSDGFQDQFGGGEKLRKFTKGNFKKLLLSVAGLEMEEQKKVILEVFEKWKGSHRQTDDVTILGLRV